MQVFRVDDMTCGHCASSIVKAVRAVDAGARVEVDLAQHLVRIEPAEADTAALSEAIADAGYTPVPMASGSPAERSARAGGCCGCCSRA
jgi:copper chaperone